MSLGGGLHSTRVLSGCYYYVLTVSGFPGLVLFACVCVRDGVLLAR